VSGWIGAAHTVEPVHKLVGDLLRLLDEDRVLVSAELVGRQEAADIANGGLEQAGAVSAVAHKQGYIRYVLVPDGVRGVALVEVDPAEVLDRSLCKVSGP
jgi:hypothetical protein